MAGPDRDSAMRVKPMRIALPVFIVPFSLMVTLDLTYNRNANMDSRGVEVILISVL
jgi:hypothetical protein